MKISQAIKINYFLVISITMFFTWLYLSYDNDKFVSASEKSISSVVTIYSYTNNRSFSNKSNGVGSGVIFSSDGYIVTNFHIVSGRQKIITRLSNGEEYEAKIIGTDNNADIAVLKIKSNSILTPINIADSSSLKTGDKVLAIGNPYGIGISVSSGIISATGRDYGNPYLRLIQTDAAINPGNSGGALVNESGNLIGINTKIYSKTGAYQGLGFAIPSNIVVQIASELIKYGKIRTMWIGNFRVKSVRINFNNNLINGLQIIEIDEIGPLYEKGIRASDIIIEINEGESSWSNLTKSLKFAALGDDIKMKLLTTSNEFKFVEIISSEIEKVN
jgi:S1-C subfamily serine protease